MIGANVLGGLSASISRVAAPVMQFGPYGPPRDGGGFQPYGFAGPGYGGPEFPPGQMDGPPEPYGMAPGGGGMYDRYDRHGDHDEYGADSGKPWHQQRYSKRTNRMPAYGTPEWHASGAAQQYGGDGGGGRAPDELHAHREPKVTPQNRREELERSGARMQQGGGGGSRQYGGGGDRQQHARSWGGGGRQYDSGVRSSWGGGHQQYGQRYGDGHQHGHQNTHISTATQQDPDDRYSDASGSEYKAR